MPLHHLFGVAARYDGNLAMAVAEDRADFKMKGTAYVFDLNSKTQTMKFPVRFENVFGGVTLARQQEFGFLSCYQVYGLGAYSLANGQEVWRRKDLKALRSVSTSTVRPWLFCAREVGASQVLDAATGKTLEKLAGVRGMYSSPFDDSVIVAARALELHSPLGHKLASFKRVDDHELQCAFSRSELVLNEPDCLRCYDLKTQELLWSHQSPPDTQYGFVCFCEAEGSFLAMRTGSHLLAFDARTGKLSREVTLAVSAGIWGPAFCRRGSEILATSLQLLSTRTGALLADLATPELLAWDPEARMERFKELAASGRSPEELERYMISEGFAKNDVERVLLMKYSNDRKKT